MLFLEKAHSTGSALNLIIYMTLKKHFLKWLDAFFFWLFPKIKGRNVKVTEFIHIMVLGHLAVMKLLEYVRKYEQSSLLD